MVLQLEVWVFQISHRLALVQYLLLVYYVDNLRFSALLSLLVTSIACFLLSCQLLLWAAADA